MPFNKEEYTSRLDAYQDAIGTIREGRADGKKILLDQRDAWRNGVLAVCFGIAAAFFAAGPNITFSDRHREILFWISSFIFLFIGLFIMVYVKNKLDSDSNELSTLMMEQEYYLAKVRNLYRDALAKQAEVDNQQLAEYLGKFKDKAHEEANTTIQNSKKIQIVDDIWTILLVLAFYFLGFAFVPLHKSKLHWYEALGLLVTALSIVYFWITCTRAKKANKQYRDWKTRLDALTY